MTTTYSIAAEHGVTIAALDDIEVPVLDRPQRQGDLGFFPRPPLGAAEPAGTPVGPEGVVLVRGEATGNTHILHAQGHVTWQPHATPADDVSLGTIHVAPAAVAWVIHTDEHGVNGLAPGVWSVRAKREQADEIRRVAD